MRYVIAMIFAVVVAAAVTLKLSDPIATWGVNQFAWESPDGADAMEALIFMLTSFAGLLLGWGIGWMIGGPLHRVPRPD